MKATSPYRAAPALAWRLRLLRLCLLAGVGVALLASDVRAQDLPEPGDGFTWQRVGDRGINVWGLAFGPDGTLWASGSDGPHRLDLSGGPPGVWDLRLHSGVYTGPLLVLGRGFQGDTLLMATGRTHRSVDGGRTWEEVHGRGGGGLFEIPPGLPHAGRILTSAQDGHARAIMYSDDRGATFTEGVVPGPGGNYASGEAFAAFPADSPHAGRLLAAGRWGVNISDDGGETWRESSMWQVLYYTLFGVAVAEEPAGGAVAGGIVIMVSDAQVWASDDGGETWGAGAGGAAGLDLPEGPPLSGQLKAMRPLGGASALAALHRGTIYRTDDAGATWKAVGRAPDINENTFLRTVVLGPDGRLYVGLSAQGGSPRGWVWRTAEVVAVPVSSEPGPEAETGLRLEVHPNPARGGAEVALTLPEAGEVGVLVYDVLGRRVMTLASGPLPAGRHPFPVEAGRLAPGVYVVRAEAGGAVVARSVTALR